MPIIKCQCPVCKEPHSAYVDNKASFLCTCGKRIRPLINGLVEIIEEPISKPAQTTTNPSLSSNVINAKAQSANTAFWVMTANVLFVVVMLILGILYAYDWINSRETNKQTADTYTSAMETPSTNKTYSNQVSPQDISPTPTPKNTVHESTIVYVHILNTFMETDKMVKCEAVLDENKNELSLIAVDQPNTRINILNQQDGVVTVQFYTNDVLDLEKPFYRRSDLETGNGTQSYTSKTGEITLSLSY